jgi:hypothetical protein
MVSGMTAIIRTTIRIRHTFTPNIHLVRHGRELSACDSDTIFEIPLTGTATLADLRPKDKG